MNRSVIQLIADGCALLSAAIGVPSLTVLLLYAINELRASGPMSAAHSTAHLNPDALSSAVSFLIKSFGDNVVLVAVSGLIVAGSLWIFGRTLQFRVSRDAEPHPSLSLSIRG